VVLAGAALVIFPAAALITDKYRRSSKRVLTQLATRHNPYHLHVATDYDGTSGDPSPHAVPPPQSPGELPYSPGEPPYPGDSGWQRRTKTSFRIAVIALVLGVAGLAVSLIGVVTQMMPRQFTAGQQQQIINWEYGKRYRDLPASTVFPVAAPYAPASELDDDPTLATLSAQRIGIARQATCRTVTDAAAAAVLDREGCRDLLRATYADATNSYVVTVGVAVLPSEAQARAAEASLAGAREVDGIRPGVHAVSFASTPARWFTNQRRQFSGAIQAGSYVVLYTAGYADSRPREPVTDDSYGDAEMMSAAAGVAKVVGSVLAPSLAPPSCPGTPGC
jgi:hypothetical protein